MTDDQIASAVHEGTLSPSAAIAALVADGETRDIAEHFVFEALGGGDIVERNGQGHRVYAVSGLLVEDVQRRMKG